VPRFERQHWQVVCASVCPTNPSSKKPGRSAVRATFIQQQAAVAWPHVLAWQCRAGALHSSHVLLSCCPSDAWALLEHVADPLCDLCPAVCLAGRPVTGKSMKTCGPPSGPSALGWWQHSTSITHLAQSLLRRFKQQAQVIEVQATRSAACC